MAKNEENQLNLTVVALVALVAIVGLVALVLNTANMAAVSSGTQQAYANPTVQYVEEAGDTALENDNNAGQGFIWSD